jgi:hypothetical protein
LERTPIFLITDFAIHTDLDAIVFQQPGKFEAGELAAFVYVEDIRTEGSLMSVMAPTN